MGKGIGINLKNDKKLIAALNKYGKNVSNRTVRAINTSVLNIESKAKVRAPVDEGTLRSSIYSRSKPKGSIVYTDLSYAPYVEFGTGTGFRLVDPDTADIASEFKGTGKRQRNHPAVPFFYNSYNEEKRKLIKKIKKIVKTAR